MSTIVQLREKISDGLDETLASVYCADAAGVAVQKTRYLKAVESFEKIFSQRDGLSLFSAPGRTCLLYTSRCV